MTLDGNLDLYKGTKNTGSSRYAGKLKYIFINFWSLFKNVDCLEQKSFHCIVRFIKCRSKLYDNYIKKDKS